MERMVPLNGVDEIPCCVFIPRDCLHHLMTELLTEPYGKREIRRCRVNIQASSECLAFIFTQISFSFPKVPALAPGIISISFFDGCMAENSQRTSPVSPP